MKPKDFVEEYVSELKQRAEDRRREGSTTAQLYDLVAAELEARRLAHVDAQLPLRVAAEESGYTPTALRRLKREGKWSGKRADLPRRPAAGGIQLVPPSPAGPSLAERVLARRRGDGRRSA